MSAMEKVSGDACPACGGIVKHYSAEQDALLRHGGYGATTRTVVTRCTECEWILTRERSEVRPPRSGVGL